jgi:peptidylprolyl isomerase
MRRYRLLLLPLVVAVLGFAACGSDDDASNETAATPTATETAAAPARVKVTGKVGEKPKITVTDGEPPSELVVRDIKKGHGAKARPGQTVTVQYSGVLLKDGQPFDNSYDRGQPFSFPLGAGQVIPGWDQGVAGMRVGGRRVLTIPPDLAYGPQGAGPIGPNETLVFVVDLKDVSAS